MSEWKRRLSGTAGSRLLGALALSLALHAALLAWPHLGQGARPAGGERGPQVRVALSFSPSAASASVSAERRPEAVPVDRADGTKAKAEVPVPIEGQTLQRGAEVMPFSGAEFYPSGELSEKPRPLGELALEDGVGGLAIVGRVVLELWIDARGEVVDVRRESSSLPAKIGEDIERAFRVLRFAPGRRYGQDVGAVLRVEAEYEARHQAP